MQPPDIAALHKMFTAKAGAEQIATEFALRGLWYWLCRTRPARILEVGTGIGTLTSLLADYAMRRGAYLVTVEDDAWCREQAIANLRGVGEHASFLEKIPDEFFDFIVVDGHQIRAHDWHILSLGGTVFFEGGRRGQRADLRDFLGDAAIEAQWRPPARTKGYSIVRVQPAWRERAWFTVVWVREWARDLPLRLLGHAVGKRA